MQVLDKGEVKLIKHSASDLDVVAAARVSNGATPEEASKGEASDGKLIGFLMKHRHGTPFEHAYFTFFVDVPLFVAREWHRHRMASYNEVSRRYVDTPPKFYIPDHVRVAPPPGQNKQGSLVSEDEDLKRLFIGEVEGVVNVCLSTYEKLLKAGVAKELARMVLPQNMYTQYYFTVNARGLMNFLSLRTAPDAQYEIRVYAEALEIAFRNLMPLTYRAFVENNRIAP